MTKQKLGLSFILSFSFIAVVVLTAFLLGAVTYFNARAFIREDIRERLRETVSIAAMDINGDLHKTLREIEDEETGAYNYFKKQFQNIQSRLKDIQFIYTVRMNDEGEIYFVVDSDPDENSAAGIGQVYARATPEMIEAFEKPYTVKVEKQFHRDEWGYFLSSYAPVFTTDGSFEAVLGIDMDADKIIAYERKYMLVIIFICAFISVFVIIIGVLISRRISYPLKLLENDMANIQKFDLESDIKISSYITEVSKMKRAVDNMKSGLRSFKKYVPDEVVAQLIKFRKEAALSGEKRELTVFFSDIAGFTGISEKYPPEIISRQLGIYFEAMAGAIIKNKGTLDKFIGDGIMAFWGAPTPFDDHALWACRAALDCQRSLENLQSEWKKTGVSFFKTRIGINTGDAIVGNMGYSERLNYTVLGDSVNLAARLEALNKEYGTKIIISEFTYEKIKHEMKTRMIDTVTVRGRTKEVKIYELLE